MSPILLPTLNLGTLLGLPSWSRGPTGDAAAVASAIVDAGYEAIQGDADEAYVRAGLQTFGMARIVAKSQAFSVLEQQQNAGHLMTTLHVGTGLEGDAEAMGLIEAILDASVRLGFPAHIETHRATITQDIWRTLRWIQHFPEITFNADLSHWYTGLEMPYGDFSSKLNILAPFFARVRFMHGRIGNGGSMQVSVGGVNDQPHLSRFEEMWSRCFAGFRRHVAPDQRIPFAPELLPDTVNTPQGLQHLNYAQTFIAPDGTYQETSDRWEQARILVDIARRLSGIKL